MHNNQLIIEGLLPCGQLDLSWLVQNSDAPLDKTVLKLLIKLFEGVNLSIHGNKIRFAKRLGGKLIRINLGDATYNGVVDSAKISQELITASESDLIVEKAARGNRSVVTIALKDICEDYQSNEMVGLKPATIKGYKTLLNRLIKHFNHIPLNKLNHCEVERWVTSNLSTAALNWKTIKETLWMLEQILNRARSSGARSVEQSFVDFKKLQKYLKRFKQRHRTVDDTKTLALDDLAKLEALSYQELKQQNLHIIRDSALLTAKAVAARSGEVRAIALEDISRNEGGNYRINISRALVLEQYKEPKAFDRSLSVVDVFDVAKPYLERLIKHAKLYDKRSINVLNENNEVVTKNVKLLVINPITGNPYSEKEYRSEFYRLQNFADISDPVAPKQLRHTAAKVFKKAGIDVEDSSKQLTHATQDTTIEFYAGVVQRGNTQEKTNLINAKLHKFWTEEQKEPGDIKKQPSKLNHSISLSKAIQRKKNPKLNQSKVFQPQEKFHQPKLNSLPNSP